MRVTARFVGAVVAVVVLAAAAEVGVLEVVVAVAAPRGPPELAHAVIPSTARTIVAEPVPRVMRVSEVSAPRFL